MNSTYFEKIEAYKTGALSEVEGMLFEEELAKNAVLQQEVEAYDLAQELIGFVGETLSTEAVMIQEANGTADLLINFTANELTETQIVNPVVSTSTKATVRELIPRINRTAWLVAASMLLILSVVGIQFYNAPSALNDLNAPIVTKEPAKEIIVEPTNTIAAKERIVVPKEQRTQPNIVDQPTPSSPKNTSKKQDYKPLIIPSTKQKIAKTAKQKTSDNASLPMVEPIVIKLAAQEITTQKVVSTGESIVYEGDNSVTLKAGFHAKAGSNFTATASNKATLLTNEVIEEHIPTIYEARNTVTLKPGFHAKAGSNFIAKAKSTDDLLTDVVVSPKEAVVFKAENTIIFKPGFHAKAGAEVAAIVGK